MMQNIFKAILVLISFIRSVDSIAQNAGISGRVTSDGKSVEYAVLGLTGTFFAATTDHDGRYEIKGIPSGNYRIHVSCVGFQKRIQNITLKDNENLTLNFSLNQTENTLNEVVITGTLKEVSRTESPIPVEVYRPSFFKKNPTPNVFDALQNVNGVRPQLNCNVCNTGDIHINGLEGPYTMVLIDGMPIVSSLSTVYGLSGIPNTLIERIEIVKGPASSLYGSEAVGGLINVITKNVKNAPRLSVDVFATSWEEYNIDLGYKLRAGKKASALTGINYFNFNQRKDKNNDGFTDMTLQNRISVFQKWNFQRNENRSFNIAGRYFYEDRFGGDTRWSKEFRGGDSIYGESIYTKRWEVIGNYELPVKEKIMLSFSYNDHDQDSRYGKTSFIARQKTGFTQLTWDKKQGRNDMLAGIALRYTNYDDNTPATSAADTTQLINRADITWLPGIFLQNEISLSTSKKLLLGFRYDYNSHHGNIYTPRLAFKWSLNDKNIIRLNAGTGYRVVNLFTEEHASLTGARAIEVVNDLNPEKSYNANVNYIRTFHLQSGAFIGLDIAAYYTYFNNRITGDFDSDPNKIIYDNLAGYAESRGISMNFDFATMNGWKILAGGTLMENTITEGGIKSQQILTENFTGTWAISYAINKLNLSIDYTGNVYSPMRLPLLGELDPRKARSPWWSIQNIQVVYSGIKRLEIYGGVKNILDWTPFRENNPFIIARSHDPFDKEVSFDNSGQVIATPQNPHALTFDPTYMYAPTQGARAFLGLRLSIQ